MVIKKIQSNEPFNPDKISLLSDTHSFLYYGGALYLCPKELNASFPTQFEDCFVSDFNAKHEPKKIVDWASARWEELQRRKFEQDEQERLRAFYEHLIYMNDEIDKYFEEEGGETDGRTGEEATGTT